MKSFLQECSAALLVVALSVEFGVAGVASHNLSSSSRPTVRLDHGTFLGNGSGNVSHFLGIPYALSPYVHRAPTCTQATLLNRFV